MVKLVRHKPSTTLSLKAYSAVPKQANTEFLAYPHLTTATMYTSTRSAPLPFCLALPCHVHHRSSNIPIPHSDIKPYLCIDTYPI